jgi:hypothetical protein
MYRDAMNSRDELIEAVETLQNNMVARATTPHGDDKAYKTFRKALLDDAVVSGRLPKFVRTCGDLAQFWGYIKKLTTYDERRQHIWAGFRPVLDYLEAMALTPSDEPTSEALTAFDADEVSVAWQRALDRRSTDPEAAITAARTLLESVCKHVIDDQGGTHGSHDDLPKLFRTAAGLLNLAPDQHSEDVFRQILGGCQTVVHGLGALRNKLGDAHGKGRRQVKPSARHAELAVNLAGAMATFLIATQSSKAS